MKTKSESYLEIEEAIYESKWSFEEIASELNVPLEWVMEVNYQLQDAWLRKK